MIPGIEGEDESVCKCHDTVSTPFQSGFLSWGIIYIWDQVIPCCGGGPVRCTGGCLAASLASTH